MLRDILTSSGSSIWPVISLIIMLTAFVSVVLWTFSGRKNRFEHESNLPLESDREDNTNLNSTRGLSS